MNNYTQNEYEKVKESVASLTGAERRYLRHLMKKNCSINGKPLSEYIIINILGTDETTTMTIIRDVDNAIDDVMKIIDQVKDHTQWEIDEEYFLKQEAEEDIENGILDEDDE